MMRKTGAGIFFLLALAAFSCSEPSSSEKFIRVQDAPDGEYRFMVELSDSTALYDLDLYTLVDGSPSYIASLTSIPLEISWVSPRLQRFSETVLLDFSGAEGSPVSSGIRVPYRKDVAMSVPGAWSVVVRVPEEYRIDGMRGLGLICTKKK